MIARRHLPNLLTAARFAAVALLLAAWYLPPPYGLWLPLLLVLLACLTDFLDGFLARRWQVESELGRLLDPNADKLLIAAALVLLATQGLAHPVAVALILCRELFVSALREYMAEKQRVIHVTPLAKWKTATQMTAVLVLLLAYALGSADIALAGAALLWLAMALTLLTGWDYACGAWRHVKGKGA